MGCRKMMNPIKYKTYVDKVEMIKFLNCVLTNIKSQEKSLSPMISSKDWTDNKIDANIM